MLLIVVMIVTPVANCPIARRKAAGSELGTNSNVVSGDTTRASLAYKRGRLLRYTLIHIATTLIAVLEYV